MTYEIAPFRFHFSSSKSFGVAGEVGGSFQSLRGMSRRRKKGPGSEIHGCSVFGCAWVSMRNGVTR